jgi:hypothetical protein
MDTTMQVMIDRVISKGSGILDDNARLSETLLQVAAAIELNTASGSPYNSEPKIYSDEVSELLNEKANLLTDLISTNLRLIVASASLSGADPNFFDRQTTGSDTQPPETVDEPTPEKTYEGYQLRVVEERDALKTKMDALSKFLNSNAVNDLTPDASDLLNRQWYAMKGYLDILDKRIALF